MKTETLALTGAALLALAQPAAADTITVDGHEVYYEIHGDLAADRPPVLLLHGGMMNIRSTFAALIPDLSRDRAVIGVEQQGHGHTPLHDGPITMESMRSDTLAVLDALGVGRAHVVGFSAGGMLGLDLAVHAPNRVASLTAISANQNADAMLPDLVAMNRDPAHVPAPETAALMPTEADMAAWQRDFAEMNPGGAEAMQVTFQKMGAFITSGWGWSDDQLTAISAPVLIAQGDNDFMPAAHGAHLADTIPGAWLAVLPDTTHLSIMAHPALPAMIAQRIDSTE